MAAAEDGVPTVSVEPAKTTSALLADEVNEAIRATEARRKAKEIAAIQERMKQSAVRKEAFEAQRAAKLAEETERINSILRQQASKVEPAQSRLE
eukprot:3167720-Prymnesium_polylepis.1